MMQANIHTKTLVLMRHGEAEDGNQDHSRNLTWKGEEQVHDIASQLEQRSLVFDLIIASDARRTTQTAEIMRHHFDNKPQLFLSPHLYHFQLGHLQDVLQLLSPSLSTILVVGHNPGISQTSNTLSQTSLYFSTAQCTILEHPCFDNESQTDLSFETLLTKNTWNLVELYTPNIRSI